MGIGRLSERLSCPPPCGESSAGWACLLLTGFKIEVENRAWWSTRPATAATLIADAARIQAVLGGQDDRDADL